MNIHLSTVLVSGEVPRTVYDLMAYHYETPLMTGDEEGALVVTQSLI